jgi:hypothetical protein
MSQRLEVCVCVCGNNITCGRGLPLLILQLSFVCVLLLITSAVCVCLLLQQIGNVDQESSCKNGGHQMRFLENAPLARQMALRNALQNNPWLCVWWAVAGVILR